MLALASDCCTRELPGCTSLSGRSPTTEAALEQAVIARFGTLGRVATPFPLRSDNDVIFTGASYTHWCDVMASTGAYHAELAGAERMIERVIRTLNDQCVHRHRFETLRHASRVIGAGSASTIKADLISHWDENAG